VNPKQDVTFVKIDVDENKETAEACEVKVVLYPFTL
jgi:hypothetical protein